MIFLQKIKSNWFIVVSAIVLALIIETPILFFPKIAGEAYRGINIPTLGGANVYEYLMRGNDVLSGYGLGSSSLKDGKNNEDYYFSIAEYLLSKPFYWLGLSQSISIVELYDAYNFLGIIAIILLIYFLVLEMSGSKLLSAATALFVVGGYSLVYNKYLFYNDFNIYGRAVFPYMGSLFFFGYLYLLRKSIASMKWLDAFLAGLSLGLLFYIYFFAWTFALAATVILFILYLFSSSFGGSAFGGDKIIAKKIGVILSLGLALGAYNIYQIFSFVNSLEGQKFSYFSWLVHGHSPIFSKIGFLTLILFIIFVWRSPKDKNNLFIFALIGAGWVALNQQILTGKILQYAHYYWFFIVPISIIVSFYMLWQLLDVGPARARQVFASLAIALVFLNTSVGQYRSSLTVLNSKLYDQNFRPLIEAVKLDKKSGVILTASDVNSTLFAIYTPHDLFWYGFALMDKTPLSRAREALLTYLYINKNSRPNISKYLEKIMADQNDASFYKDLYMAIEGQSSGLDYYDYINKSNDTKIIGEHRKKTIDELNKEYKLLFKPSTGFTDLLKKYDVNYIVWDKNKHAEWDLSVIANLKEVAVSNSIFLYEKTN